MCIVQQHTLLHLLLPEAENKDVFHFQNSSFHLSECHSRKFSKDRSVCFPQENPVFSAAQVQMLLQQKAADSNLLLSDRYRSCHPSDSFPRLPSSLSAADRLL